MRRSTQALSVLGIGLLALGLRVLWNRAPEASSVHPAQATSASNEQTTAALEPHAEEPVDMRQVLVEPSVPSEEQLLDATLVSLAMLAPDRVEAYGGTLVLRSPSTGAELRAIPDAAGSVPVPSGSWWVAAADEGFHVEPRFVRVSPGDRRTVFVSRRHGLRRQVLSTSGAPIEGAAVKWIGRGTPSRLVPQSERPLARFGRSGPDGWITLDDDALLDTLLGKLHVVAKGFEPGTFLIDLSRSDEHPSCVLRPSAEGASSAGILTFIARGSGEPVPGVRLLTRMGELPGASNTSGQFELPSWIEGTDWLEVRHATFGCSNGVNVAQALQQGGRVELGQEVEIRIDPSSERPGTLVVIERPEGNAGPRVRGTIRDSRPYAKGERPSVRLAVGTAVLAVSIAEDGTVHKRTWRVHGSTEAITLKWSEEESLELVLREASGAPVREALVRIGHENWGEFRLLTNAQGMARIPSPDDVYSILATQRSRALVSLSNAYQKPGEEVPSSGRLELIIDEIGDLAVLLQDQKGHPMPGLGISLWETGGVERVQLYPQLDGDRPTSHPAWGRGVPRAPEGISDLSGMALIHNVLAGSFNIEIDVARLRDPERSPFSLEMRGISVGPPWDELVLTIPAPIFVHLRARDAATGRAITPLALRSMSRVGGRNPDVEGSTWLGWLNPEEGPYRATVPGYEALELSSDELRGEPDRDLFLWPSGGAVLELEAAPELLESLEGRRLKVEALRPVSSELPWFQRGTWSGEAIIRNGQAHLPLAFEGQYTLKPIELNGRLLPIEPADFTWQGEPRIQAHL